MPDFEKILSGGDLRSIGNSNAVASQIKNQKDFDTLFEYLFHEDRIVVMHASDAIEKITIQHPIYLNKHKKNRDRKSINFVSRTTYQIFIIFGIMKLLSAILLLTISILTVAPVSQIYSVNETCTEDCCSNDTKSNEEQKGPDCCPTGICNPFQVCACCVTISTENISLQFNPYHTVTKNRPTADKINLSDYSNDCWQPPETLV